MNTEKQISQAVATMLGHCDGALQKDGIGFNGTDASFVRSVMAQSVWSYKQRVAVYKLLKKYRNQLSNYGVDYDAIPNPASEEEIKKVKKVEQEKAVESGTDTLDKTVEKLLALTYTPWKTVETARGRSQVRSTVEFPNWFWDVWKKYKGSIKEKGFSVSKNPEGKWQLSQWREDVESKKVVEEYHKAVGENLPQLSCEDKLLSYQVDHVKRMVLAVKKYDATLDGSITGSGKSFSSIAVAKELNTPAFIVCPKTIIPSWKRVLKHFDLSEDNYEGVINYEMLKTGKTEWVDLQIEKKKNRKGKMEKIYHFTYNLPKNTLIIADEIHRCRNKKTQNAALLIAAKEQGYKILGLSATIGDNPMHFYTMGYIMGLFQQLKDFYKWAYRYGCRRSGFGGSFEFDGGEQDIKNLHLAIYGDGRGHRLTDKDVGDAFPKNIIDAEVYDMGSAAVKIQEIYDEMREQLKGLAKKSKDDSDNRLTIRLRARQKAEILKVPTLVDRARSYVEEGQSVAIFVNFNDTVDALVEKLGTNCIVRGGQSSKVREQNIADFQSDTERTIIVNIAAGGEGCSLHDLNGKHSRVSLISPSDSALKVKQSLGRIVRAEAKTPCLQKIIFCAGTEEEKVCENVRAKIDRINMINDGDLESGTNI